jgi:hypothetical protein
MTYKDRLEQYKGRGGKCLHIDNGILLDFTETITSSTGTFRLLEVHDDFVVIESRGVHRHEPKTELFPFSQVQVRE